MRSGGCWEATLVFVVAARTRRLLVAAAFLRAVPPLLVRELSAAAAEDRVLSSKSTNNATKRSRPSGNKGGRALPIVSLLPFLPSFFSPLLLSIPFISVHQLPSVGSPSRFHKWAVDPARLRQLFWHLALRDPRSCSSHATRRSWATPCRPSPPCSLPRTSSLGRSAGWSA